MPCPGRVRFSACACDGPDSSAGSARRSGRFGSVGLIRPGGFRGDRERFRDFQDTTSLLSVESHITAVLAEHYPCPAGRLDRRQEPAPTRDGTGPIRPPGRAVGQAVGTSGLAGGRGCGRSNHRGTEAQRNHREIPHRRTIRLAGQACHVESYQSRGRGRTRSRRGGAGGPRHCLVAPTRGLFSSCLCASVPLWFGLPLPRRLEPVMRIPHPGDLSVTPTAGLDTCAEHTVVRPVRPGPSDAITSGRTGSAVGTLRSHVRRPPLPTRSDRSRRIRPDAAGGGSAADPAGRADHAGSGRHRGRLLHVDPREPRQVAGVAGGHRHGVRGLAAQGSVGREDRVRVKAGIGGRGQAPSPQIGPEFGRLCMIGVVIGSYTEASRRLSSQKARAQRHAGLTRGGPRSRRFPARPPRSQPA